MFLCGRSQPSFQKVRWLTVAMGVLVWQVGHSDDWPRFLGPRDTARDFKVPEAFFGVGSSPLLEGNRLIVIVGGQPNAGVVAFDPDTGRTLWQSVGRANWEDQPMLGWPGERQVAWRDTDKQASYATPVAATIRGRRIVFCLM